MIEPGKAWWRCYGCGESGDAANLVMRLEGLTFPGAVARLTGGSALSGSPWPRLSTKARRPASEPLEAPEGPKGLPLAAALALVVESEARLWSAEGSEALTYLTGRRYLTPATIRTARLGWTPRADGVPWTPPGIVIPWAELDHLSLVKIRPPDEWRESFPESRRPPKYLEAFRDRPNFYPKCRLIRTGHPLIVVEGELDCLLLGQELEGLATVGTLGGAGSTKPEPVILGKMLAAASWFIATDGDEAGDKAAARWEGTRAVRVRPPEPFKDWTDAARAGVNLRSWWADRLGVPFPPYPWNALAGWRWGPAAADPEPGILIDRQDPTRSRLVPETIASGPSHDGGGGDENL
jgi:hypothetical protein